ncbi:MAG: porin [Gammaproteobacteria bacterium]|nr:porin [Gammaproteobacteria bacterium]
MQTRPTLIAIAVLSLLSPAAYAGIEVYGTAHVSLDYVGNDDPDPANDDRSFSLTSEHSYLGLRGREVLQNQMAVLWQAENTIDLDAGGWGPGRDTFVGLDTRFGSLRLGKHATPYRMTTEALDVFADSRADYNAIIGSVDGRSLFNNRADNALLYMTPRDKRLRFALAYSTRVAGEDDLPLTADESRQDGWSTALEFVSGPLYLGLAYESLGELMGPGLDDARAAKLGLGWDFGQGTRMSFIWEDARTGETGGDGEVARTAYYLNLAHVQGNLTYRLACGLAQALDSAPDSGARFLALGGGYALSARTELYLLYARVMNDDAGGYGLQPDHDGSGAVAVAGDTADAFSVGVTHRFSVEF